MLYSTLLSTVTELWSGELLMLKWQDPLSQHIETGFKILAAISRLMVQLLLVLKNGWSPK
jgi:hypothetical protein